MLLCVLVQLVILGLIVKPILMTVLQTLVKMEELAL